MIYSVTYRRNNKSNEILVDAPGAKAAERYLLSQMPSARVTGICPARAAEFTPDAPVLALSPDEEKSLREKFMAAGLDDLNLSVRSYNSLRRSGINTVGELVSLTEDQQAELDESFQKSWIDANGIEKYTQICKTLDLTSAEFKDVISISYKNTQLMDYLFGEGGIYEITEDELRNKYSEGYERFRYIALSKVDETGATLSTDELITKKNLVDEAYQKALDGEEFGELIAQYSEDYLEITDELTDDEKTFYEASNKQASEDGLVIDKNGIFNYEYYAYYNYFIDSNIVNAVFSMNIGDVKVIELANAFWVIQKCDKNEKEDYFESKRSLIYNEIASPIIDELYTEWENELLITFNESAVNKYDPRKLDPLFITDNTAK